MHTAKVIFLVLGLVWSADTVRAQDSTAVIPTPAESIPSLDNPSRNWAIGVRIGEPLGLTVRRFLGAERMRAIEVNIGTFGGLWATERRHGPGQYRNTGTALNVQALWFDELSRSGRLQAFYGFGAQLNTRRRYSRDPLDPSNRKRPTMGASGTLGLEYRFPNRPISMFLDGGLYAEILFVPLWLHVQAGGGLRFQF